MVEEIVEYYPLSRACPDDLSKIVNTWLAMGWKLYGSPSIASSTDEMGSVESVYIQAIVRMKESIE